MNMAKDRYEEVKEDTIKAASRVEALIRKNGFDHKYGWANSEEMLYTLGQLQEIENRLAGEGEYSRAKL